MSENIYVDTAGNFYSSTYPFSVDDTLVPFVTPAFRALLLSAAPKPNVTQKTIDLLNYGLTSDMRNGLADASLLFAAATRELRQYGGNIIVPPGDYLFEEEVMFWPGISIYGSPGSTRIFSRDVWRHYPERGKYDYAFLASYNDALAGITPTPASADREDGNCVFQGLFFDYSQITWISPFGGKHAVRAFAMKNMVVDQCRFLWGEDAVAFLGCENTKIMNSTALENSNCAWDHWCEPRSASVINCSQINKVRGIAQAINFNPDTTEDVARGEIADGFIAIGNYTEGWVGDTNLAPWQIEPLRLGNVCRNVLLANNQLVRSYFVLRGNLHGAIVADNILNNEGYTVASVFCYDWDVSNIPRDISVKNNTITQDTPANAFGAIRVEADYSEVVGNKVNNLTGGAPTAGIYTTFEGTLVAGNSVANGLITAPGFYSSRQDERMAPGKYVGFATSLGRTVRFVNQSGDNNFILYGTNVAGGNRPIWSVYMDSDVSEYILSVDQLFNPDVQIRWTVAELACQGINIATTAIASQFTKIISASAGVDDACILRNLRGMPYFIWNTTAVNVSLFPANTGASRIDGGAIGAALVIPAQSRLIVAQMDATNYLSFGVRP